MEKKLTLIFVSAMIFLFISCDYEKYISSNLSVKSNPVDSTEIKGVIRRKDTGSLVKGATIQIGYTLGKSDSLGGFGIRFPISEDNNRNMAEPLIISAYNFKDYVEYIYPTPVPISREIKLVYAAPIITNVEISPRPGTQPRNYKFYVNVIDYQGNDDVVSVMVTFKQLYLKDPTNVILARESVWGDRWESQTISARLKVRERERDTFLTIRAWDKDGHLGVKSGWY